MSDENETCPFDIGDLTIGFSDPCPVCGLTGDATLAEVEMYCVNVCYMGDDE